MIELSLGGRGSRSVLAFGAHCDDVEIGAGATLLRLAGSAVDLRVRVVVLSSTPERAEETRSSIPSFLPGVQVDLEVHALRDGRLPAQWDQAKDIVEAVAATFEPDVVLAPHRRDAHQDHATLAALVTTAFRDHLVLGYEIPKWDGDLSRAAPTHYVALTDEQITRKCALLRKHYPSQLGHDWFIDETFRGLARLRGMECRADYAEAFHVEKALLTLD
ncbi:MAG: PIG-L deacetylase family protein [Egibacteraceae bacterium]